MKRNRTKLTVVVACGLAVGALSFGGCAKKKPTRTGDIATPTTDPYAQMSELRRKAAELTAMTTELPGDRQQFAAAFSKTSEALELLGGPEPVGAFRQQLRIIDNTYTTLSSSEAISTVPVTDSGLRAVQNALTAVSDRLFPGDASITEAMDKLRTRINDLDTERGALHSAVAAQAFQSAASVIDAMATELDARVIGAPASASQPPVQ